MLAHAVEAHGSGEDHIFPQGAFRGCRHESVRPVSLIEHQAHRIWPAVEHDLFALHGDRTQCRIGTDFVEHFVSTQQPDLGFDEGWLFGRPQQLIAVVIDSRVREAHAPVHLAADDGVGIVGEHARAAVEADLDAQVRCGQTGRERR
jgi:hypothetical protein